MKRALRWEKHGEMWRALDEFGWTLYIAYSDLVWCAVGPLASSAEPERFASPRRRTLFAMVARDWRNRC